VHEQSYEDISNSLSQYYDETDIYIITVTI